MTYIIHYLLTFAVFLLIDFVWLGYLAKDFYRRELGSMLLEKFKLFPAILFYLIFIFGLIVLVVYPAFVQNDFNRLVMTAALFGFVTYATYDFTNLATMKNWSVRITVIDLAWGSILSVVVATASYLLAIRIF